jgi:hypothetical protein
MLQSVILFKILMILMLLLMVRHTSKLNYRTIVNIVQRDSVCRYLFYLYVSVSCDHLQKVRR